MALCCVCLALPGTAEARPIALVAYPTGAASGTHCPKSSDVAKRCTLTHALTLLKRGGSVQLAVGGDETDPATFYVGNFNVSTPNTTARSRVTIRPAKGVR